MPNTLCKTIRQYNKEQISKADMEKLMEIAEDYRKVKNYVYQRYSGPTSLTKLYPGYTIQNEMTKIGLRGELGLPSVYFYLAVFEALGDIKTQWTMVKTNISRLAGQNENFSQEEKHYLRFLLKIPGAFEAVLNRQEIVLQGDMKKQYEYLVNGDGEHHPDIKKVHNYLCRQVRKKKANLNADKAKGFAVSHKAYRYEDHGIYLSSKEKRKRIYIPLTDNNQYQSQLYIKLYPDRGDVEIHVPIQVTVREHPDYMGQVGLSLRMKVMLTTDQGHEYGEDFGRYHMDYAEWVRMQTKSYHLNRSQNPGRKKYIRRKRQYEEQLHSYINQELNRFFRTEKPKILYLPKLPGPSINSTNKKINHSVTLWQRGYIRSRLEQKCREQSVKIVEVLGKDISNVCSVCGSFGQKVDGMFFCGSCGRNLPDRLNAAQNAKKRGMKEETVVKESKNKL